MKNSNKTINNVVYDTTLDSDISVALIDKTLIDSHSIMYTRQATYLYLMKLTGVDLKTLRKQILWRAKLGNIEVNRGVLNKESDVANVCLIEKAILFNKVDFSKKNPAESIKIIANIMVNNKLSYTYLKKEGYFNGESSKEKKQDNKVESTESKSITSLQAVIDFIENTTQENRLKLADILTAAIEANAGKRETEAVAAE